MTDGNKKQTGTEVNQRRAIAALLIGPTVKAAARRARVGERTLNTWLTADKQFRRELVKAQDAVLASTIARLSGEMAKSIDTLVSIRDAKKNSAHVRMRAAVNLIQLLTRLRELGELAGRVDELEQRLAAPAARVSA